MMWARIDTTALRSPVLSSMLDGRLGPSIAVYALWPTWQVRITTPRGVHPATVPKSEVYAVGSCAMRCGNHVRSNPECWIENGLRRANKWHPLTSCTPHSSDAHRTRHTVIHKHIHTHTGVRLSALFWSRSRHDHHPDRDSPRTGLTRTVLRSALFVVGGFTGCLRLRRRRLRLIDRFNNRLLRAPGLRARTLQRRD